MQIKIAIVEDDKDLRNMLEAFFNSYNDLKVVAAYPNGNLFLNDLNITDCDVVIMDINMPGKSGIDCIAEAKPQRPQIQYVVSTSFENHEFIFKALCAGATGYLLKSDKPDALVDAVRSVMEGGSPMSASIARLVVTSFQKPAVKSEALHLLSEREQEVVLFLSQGLNYREISEKVFISPETVRTHIRNIYSKLQVKSKTEAVNKIFPR
ncbi:MAG TPA: response regulator transcription factor [Bacteroidia bacterium]|nr:response regulator transcription factor [Bacteroidia bacterium]HNU33155.1 response regulator transcription factor [Bacteroidia bacterium]